MEKLFSLFPNMCMKCYFDALPSLCRTFRARFFYINSPTESRVRTENKKCNGNKKPNFDTANTHSKLKSQISEFNCGVIIFDGINCILSPTPVRILCEFQLKFLRQN